jgi:hypothetical protein
MQNFDLGRATIEPQQPVVAGSYTTIVFTYTAGHPIDDTGCVKIVFRQIGDFGVPQFNDPAAPNYCTIRTTGDCSIIPRWDPKGHTRPWSRALFLLIFLGYLNTGEQIIVTFGDTSGGSSGWRMQSFCEETFEFKTLVDPIATYEFKELPKSPELSVVAGEAARIACIAPSRVQVNEAFTYYVKLEDRWGNPTHKPKKRTHPGFSETGLQTITANDETTGFSALSNPIDVLSEDRPLRLFWADFHGQSEETIGSNSIEDYFHFARDYGLLDISAHQGNDFQVTDEFWKKINRVTKACYEPGAFVTFPGFEWSGNTPLGGDRNVYFTSEGGEITRSCTDLLPDKHSVHKDSPTAEDLFDNLRKQQEPKSFAFAHVGGRYADLGMHDPEIEVAVEVHSAWGTFEWLVDEALTRGYRVGICANSDGHKCRPGASYPGASTFGSLGGLTCVIAEQLDRQHIFNALKARHFYATTGNRSLVEVTLETDDGRRGVMGGVIENGRATPLLSIRVVGTTPVESVEVRNGLETLETLRPYGEDHFGSRIKLIWGGAMVRGRGRNVSWDGALRVKDNTILGVQPINFWNADQPLESVGGDRLVWTSMTTGGIAGMILTLEKPDAGSLEVETLQKNVNCAVGSVGMEPKIWQCGGVQKRIEISRLPGRQSSCEYSFTLPVNGLRPGDNPIYIRMTQEDGHMAWTSPIYLVCPSS